MMIRRVSLTDRALLLVQGEDRIEFLHNLISNSVNDVGPDASRFATLLTPTGKFLHEFFVIEYGSALLLDCDASRMEDLRRRLSMYRLRAKVSLAGPDADLCVVALLGPDAPEAVGLPPIPGATKQLDGAVAFVDARHAGLGVRLIVPSGADDQAGLALPEFPAAELEAYHDARLALGIPNGATDIVVEKSTLLEANYDHLNAIDWKKGCFIGQEVTARTRYRGLLKRRLVPVVAQSPLPEPGALVTGGDREVGELRSGANGRALALMRLDALDRTDLEVAGVPLKVDRPAWWRPTTD